MPATAQVRPQALGTVPSQPGAPSRALQPAARGSTENGILRIISGELGPQTADFRSSDARDILSPLIYSTWGAYTLGRRRRAAAQAFAKRGRQLPGASSERRAGSPSKAVSGVLRAFR